MINRAARQGYADARNNLAIGALPGEGGVRPTWHICG